MTFDQWWEEEGKFLAKGGNQRAMAFSSWLTGYRKGLEHRYWTKEERTRDNSTTEFEGIK